MPAIERKREEVTIERKGGGGRIRVVAEGDLVNVYWSCGAARVFTKEGVRSVLSNFESVNLVEDLLYSDRDKDGRGFVCVVVDGQFQAGEGIFPFREESSFPWKDVKAALVKFSAAPKARRKASTTKKPAAKKAAKPRASRAKKTD